jgi:hypothetical protein
MGRREAGFVALGGASLLAAGLLGGAVPAGAAVRTGTASAAKTTVLGAKTTVPAVPFVESVSAVGLGVLVAWDPVASASHVQSFSVTATPASGAPSSCPAKTVTVGASDTQALVGGLCAGVVYTAAVKARNAGGSSAASPASAPVVPLAAQPPGTPLITSVLGRAGALVVSWAPPAENGGSAVTGYTVTATAGANTVTAKAAASADTATVAGLRNGTRYSVSVTASNARGTSAAAASSGAPAAAHAPAAPGGLTVVPDGKGGLDVSWSAPADNGGAAITRYTVSYQRAVLNGSTGAWTAARGAPVHRFSAPSSASTLTAKTFEAQKGFYLFSITAANRAGTSAAATMQAAVTPVVTRNSSAVVLTRATVAALSGVSGSALIWNDPAPAQARGLRGGQTVVATVGALLPQGTLRRVVSVRNAGGKLTVTTAQGQLSNAVSAMGLDATVNPAEVAASPAASAASGAALQAGGTGAGRFVPTMAGVRVIPNVSATAGKSVTLSIDVKSGPVSVQAEASLTSTVSVSLGVHQGFAGIPNGVSVSATAKVTAALSGTVNVTGRWSTQIGEIEGAPIDIQAGPVPVVIEPKVPVFLTVSGSTGLGIQVSDTIGGSVAWSSSDPGHLTVTTLSAAPSLKGSVVAGLTMTGDVSVGLQVQPQVDIYDAAGPNVQGTLSLNADVAYNPAPGDPFLTIDPKLELQAGVDLDLFRVHASLEATIGSYEFAAFTIAVPPAASYAITPADPTVAAGGTLALTAARSDGAAEPLTWGLIGAAKSDSISADGTLRVSAPADRTLTVTVSDASGAAGQTTVTVGSAFDAPAAVTAVQQAGRAGATVSWIAPAATGGSPLAGYTILTSPSTGPHTVGAGATALTLPSLKPGSYAVSVYARNTRGQASPPGTALLAIDGAALTFDHSQSLDVSAEDPDTISCPTTSFCLAVGYFGEVAIDRSGQWSSGPGVTGAVAPSLSCVSASFCVVAFQAESGSGSQARIFNGTRWSAPVTIDSGSAGPVSSLSCASTSLCFAADYGGRVIRYTGSGWGKPAALLPAGSTTSVSCSAPSACVATSETEWARYRSGKWSAAEATGRGIVVTAVSCVSAAYCVGIGFADNTNDGASTTFNGSTWSAPAVITSYGGVSGADGLVQSQQTFSCRSAKFCLAVDWNGVVHRFDGTSWHMAGKFSMPVYENSFVVSCATTSWCEVAGDVSNADIAATWTPTGLSRTADFGATIYAVSCASSSFCVAAGNDQLDQSVAVASVFNGTRWSTPTIVDPAGQDTSVSCPSASFCMLVLWNGDAVSYRAGVWSAPHKVERGPTLLSVSCASSSFCVAVDGAGNAYTDNGIRWSGPVVADAPSYDSELLSVSCPTSIACVAVDAAGRAVTDRAGRWSAPAAVPGLTSVNSVDCTSSSFCIAAGEGTGGAGELAAAKLSGASWSSLGMPGVSADDSYASVSCATSSFCGIGGTESAPLVYANGGVTPTFSSSPGLNQAISCPVVDWCAAAGWATTMNWSDTP